MAEWASAYRNRLIPNSWSIDRERGLVFICFGFSQPTFKNDEMHMLGEYALYLNCTQVQVKADEVRRNKSGGGKTLHYEVHVHRPIPLELEPLRPQLLGWLQEAFEAHGRHSLEQSPVKAIAVASSVEVTIMKGEFL
jgi:hypothetical protein